MPAWPPVDRDSRGAQCEYEAHDVVLIEARQDGVVVVQRVCRRGHLPGEEGLFR
jgi:hypothetical protein